MRSLGLAPTEQQIREIVLETQDDEPNQGVAPFRKFLPVAMRALSDSEYPRDPADKILRAFRALDTENRGYIEPEELRMHMTRKGEKYSPEEIQDMLSEIKTHGQDPETLYIYYEDFAALLAE